MPVKCVLTGIRPIKTHRQKHFCASTDIFVRDFWHCSCTLYPIRVGMKSGKRGIKKDFNNTIASPCDSFYND